MPAAGRASSTSSRSNNIAFEHSYLNAFRETVKDFMETVREKDDERTREIGKRVGLLTTRLRETVIEMHAAVFFLG